MSKPSNAARIKLGAHRRSDSLNTDVTDPDECYALALDNYLLGTCTDKFEIHKNNGCRCASEPCDDTNWTTDNHVTIYQIVLGTVLGQKKTTRVFLS